MTAWRKTMPNWLRSDFTIWPESKGKFFPVFPRAARHCWISAQEMAAGHCASHLPPELAGLFWLSRVKECSLKLQMGRRFGAIAPKTWECGVPQRRSTSLLVCGMSWAIYEVSHAEFKR